ncbi:MAG: hypothetical protein ABW164_00815 [Sphingobium sp.]
MTAETRSIEESNTEVALNFIQHLAADTMEPSMMTEDFKVWTASHGEMEPSAWFAAVRALTNVLNEPLKSTPIGVTAQGERVAIEAVSHGNLSNGEHYSNNYHFLVIVREGKVAQVKAYFSTRLAAEKLGPLFAAAAQS